MAQNSEWNITSEQVTPSIFQFFPMVNKLMTLILATSYEFTQIIQKIMSSLMCSARVIVKNHLI